MWGYRRLEQSERGTRSFSNSITLPVPRPTLTTVGALIHTGQELSCTSPLRARVPNDKFRTSPGTCPRTRPSASSYILKIHVLACFNRGHRTPGRTHWEQNFVAYAVGISMLSFMVDSILDWVPCCCHDQYYRFYHHPCHHYLVFIKTTTTTLNAIRYHCGLIITYMRAWVWFYDSQFRVVSLKTLMDQLVLTRQVILCVKKLYNWNFNI